MPAEAQAIKTFGGPTQNKGFAGISQNDGFGTLGAGVGQEGAFGPVGGKQTVTVTTTPSAAPKSSTSALAHGTTTTVPPINKTENSSPTVAPTSVLPSSGSSGSHKG